jgi:hypothetical protein
MLIKSVTKNGDAVALSPEEALIPAINIGLSIKNNSEFVFWTADKAAEVSNFSIHPKDKGQYEAIASGSINIGKTRVSDDQFFVAKPHSFQIQYNSSKDEIGAPHINVASFEMEAIDTNPANYSGPAPVVLKKEDMSIKGGKITSKVAR